MSISTNRIAVGKRFRSHDGQVKQIQIDGALVVIENECPQKDVLGVKLDGRWFIPAPAYAERQFEVTLADPMPDIK